MQYILSEEEYKALVNAKVKLTKMSRVKLQSLCTKICNEMPVKWGWKGMDHPKPWTCIHTHKEDDCEWYCDQCPVIEICPETDKNWSK